MKGNNIEFIYILLNQILLKKIDQRAHKHQRVDVNIVAGQIGKPGPMGPMGYVGPQGFEASITLRIEISTFNLFVFEIEEGENENN